MAKFILKWRYIKSGTKGHGTNLVKYIATRDGVELCNDSWKQKPATIPQNTADIAPTFADTRYKTEELYMPEGTVRDMLRREIVGKSIQILRSHGKSDDEIKEMMLNDFSISEAVLDELLNAQVQNR